MAPSLQLLHLPLLLHCLGPLLHPHCFPLLLPCQQAREGPCLGPRHMPLLQQLLPNQLLLTQVSTLIKTSMTMSLNYFMHTEATDQYNKTCVHMSVMQILIPSHVCICQSCRATCHHMCACINHACCVSACKAKEQARLDRLHDVVNITSQHLVQQCITCVSQASAQSVPNRNLLSAFINAASSSQVVSLSTSCYMSLPLIL